MLSRISYHLTSNLRTWTVVVSSPATSTGVPGTGHGYDRDIRLFVLPDAPPPPVGWAVSGLFFSVSAEYLNFEIGEQHFGRKLRGISAQEGHQHNSPGDDQINGDGAFDTFGGFMSGVFGAASRLEHAMPVFNAPTQAVPAQAHKGVLFRLYFHRGQQEPLNGLCI